jgi:hypothetical protein
MQFREIILRCKDINLDVINWHNDHPVYSFSNYKIFFQIYNFADTWVFYHNNKYYTNKYKSKDPLIPPLFGWDNIPIFDKHVYHITTLINKIETMICYCNYKDKSRHFKEFSLVIGNRLPLEIKQLIFSFIRKIDLIT